MFKLEKILGVLAVIGIILQLAFIPGAGIVMVLSVTTLALLYYFLGFALFNRIGFKEIFKQESYNGISTQRIIGSIGAGWAISLICLGILFKLQHFPGSKILLIVGLIATLLVLAIALTEYKKTKEEFYIGLFGRIAVISTIGLLTIVISVM